MKFKIKTQDVGSSDGGRWEEYDLPITDADKWATDTLARFNSSLRPNEPARELLEVAVLDARKNTSSHEWIKTSLATMESQHGTYDVYRCKSCRITGKRYGLGSTVIRDSIFRAKAFADCDKAKARLLASPSPARLVEGGRR